MDNTPEPVVAVENDVVSARLLAVLEQLIVTQARRENTALQGEFADRFGQHAQAAQAEALLALVQQHSRREPPMAPEQAAIELRFRALRNALGSFGGRAAPADVALMPSPLLYPDGRLLFDYDFPDRAQILVLMYDKQPSREVDISRLEGSPPSLTDAGDVVGVQVDDTNRTPLLLGIPYRVPAVRGSRTRRS